MVKQTIPNSPIVYQIRLQGHLEPHWTQWFEGATLTLESDGETVLTVPVQDQSALFGLLRKVRDTGIPLISVFRVDDHE
jgi:hypothetical protein